MNAVIVFVWVFRVRIVALLRLKSGYTTSVLHFLTEYSNFDSNTDQIIQMKQGFVFFSFFDIIFIF